MGLPEQGHINRNPQTPMSYLVAATLAVGQDGVEHPAFEARRELQCVRCNGAIVTGEHFTKQRSLRSGPKNRKEYPCCQRCYPFEEVADTRPPICL